MLEKEMKILLTKEQYNDLRQVFNFENRILQINFYYMDKKGYTNERNITIRIRGILDKLALQIKIPYSLERSENFLPSIHQKCEYSKMIDSIPHFISEAELYKLCGQHIGNVYLTGFMVTERMVYMWNQDIRVCLDRNSYLGKCDYELEIEHEDCIDENLIKKINGLKISVGKSIKGKNSRYFEALKSLDSCGENIF